MLRIKNKTPFKTTMSLQTDLQGYDVVCVYFSSSFYFSNGNWYVSDDQIASPMSDQFWDTEKASSIRYPSQISFDKLGTDVIINAEAVSPGGVPVDVLPVDVLVGNLRASLLVFGDRIWEDGHITNPKLFSRIPIIWENAFGGTAIFDKKELDSNELNNNEQHLITHEYNPLGMGWTHPQKNIQNGTRLPNIEWRGNHIQNPRDTPMPAGLGALAVENPQRAQYAGTYDEQWKITRCPFAPDDFHPNFFRSAVKGLRYDGFMQGNEPVRLKNVHTIEDLAFDLPNATPSGTLTVNGDQQGLNFKLDTLVIETHDVSFPTVRLFWQANGSAARSVADIEEATIELLRS